MQIQISFAGEVLPKKGGNRQCGTGNNVTDKTASLNDKSH
jgi:hypothetical protein